MAEMLDPMIIPSSLLLLTPYREGNIKPYVIIIFHLKREEAQQSTIIIIIMKMATSDINLKFGLL